jgi:hypothetical protein
LHLSIALKIIIIAFTIPRYLFVQVEEFSKKFVESGRIKDLKGLAEAVSMS